MVTSDVPTVGGVEPRSTEGRPDSLCIIVGNRPQFIKIAPLLYHLDKNQLNYTLVHTGQHYDHAMSGVFFDELGLRTPDYQLEIEGRSHAEMTAGFLTKLEALLQHISPKGVLVVGDTNSTLAGALAAVKLHLKIAHLEAGPRLGDLRTPEEANRIIADHLSTVCFAPDENSLQNLEREGLRDRSVLSGDVMFDAFALFRNQVLAVSQLLARPELRNVKSWIYLTLHRPFNVDHRECHERLIAAIAQSTDFWIFPVHARTRARMSEFNLSAEYESLSNLLITTPLGYLDSIAAIQRASLVITDSGGVQKEAYWAGKKSVLLLDVTPWPMLRDSGWQLVANSLDKVDLASIVRSAHRMPTPHDAPPFFGDGRAAEQIVTQLRQHGFL